MYVFAPNTLQLRGGHRLCPGGLATVIRQVLAPSELGLFPTANSPGSGSQTSLFASSVTSTWTSFTPWMVGSLPLPILSPQLTAAAGNYAYVFLRVWADRRRRGARRTSPLPMRSLLALPIHVDVNFSSSFCLGDTGVFGPGF
jgi:hypothetical protein